MTAEEEAVSGGDGGLRRTRRSLADTAAGSPFILGLAVPCIGLALFSCDLEPAVGRRKERTDVTHTEETNKRNKMDGQRWLSDPGAC